MGGGVNAWCMHAFDQLRPLPDSRAATSCPEATEIIHVCFSAALGAHALHGIKHTITIRYQHPKSYAEMLMRSHRHELHRLDGQRWQAVQLHSCMLCICFKHGATDPVA